MGGQCMMGAIKAGWEGRRGGGAITIMWAQGSHANHHSDCWIVKFCQEESWYICVPHLFKIESESKRAACDMFGFNVSQAWIGVWQLGRRWRNWEHILHHHCMINDQVVQKLSTCWNMLALPCRLVNTNQTPSPPALLFQNALIAQPLSSPLKLFSQKEMALHSFWKSLSIPGLCSYSQQNLHNYAHTTEWWKRCHYYTKNLTNQ